MHLDNVKLGHYSAISQEQRPNLINQSGEALMETLLKDIRYGVRNLLKHPGFTAIAVITLALGIGANTAIFSVVNAVLLRALPFPNADRLVMVWEDASYAGFPRNTPAPANYADLKAQNSSFEEMAAMDMRNFNLTGDGEPEKIEAFGVTANFFPMLGIKPVLGRPFLSEEDKPEVNKVVIINHSLWQQRYGGVRSIIARGLLLYGAEDTVVRVMTPCVHFFVSDTKVWMSIAV